MTVALFFKEPEERYGFLHFPSKGSGQALFKGPFYSAYTITFLDALSGIILETRISVAIDDTRRAPLAVNKHKR